MSLARRTLSGRYSLPRDPLLRAPPAQSHPAFKCIICIGGVRPGAAVARPLFTEKLRLPSLHIIGDRDQIRKVHLGCMCWVCLSRDLLRDLRCSL